MPFSGSPHGWDTVSKPVTPFGTKSRSGRISRYRPHGWFLPARSWRYVLEVNKLMGWKITLCYNFPKWIEPLVSCCPGRSHTNSEPETLSGPKIKFWSSLSKWSQQPVSGCLIVGIRTRSQQPHRSENHVLIKFLKISPNAAFWLARLWGYEFQASNPIGTKITLWSNFPKSTLLPISGYPGRGDTY